MKLAFEPRNENLITDKELKRKEIKNLGLMLKMYSWEPARRAISVLVIDQPGYRLNCCKKGS